jgi:predicted choloylglycine hydrolase
MEVDFRALFDAGPGKVWADTFAAHWPAYEKWWLKEGIESRPSFMEGRLAIKTHMPEILELYDEICELAGGGDKAARFLSFWRPPPYLAACSQAVWPGNEPLLVRNYDYNPHAFDAVVLQTDWCGRRVVGSSDGMWGLVDGMNDAGLAVSLTFGGRRVVGDGFGVPLILRYVLQTCDTAKQAGDALKRIPTHMSYNVTAVDAKHDFVTAFMSPDRGTTITHAAVATNHQERVEWSSHARFTATVEREKYLLQRLTLHVEPAEKFIGAFLKPPLYSVAYGAGFGTLYTAVYRPGAGEMELRWPGSSWLHRLDHPNFETRRISYPRAA